MIQSLTYVISLRADSATWPEEHDNGFFWLQKMIRPDLAGSDFSLPGR